MSRISGEVAVSVRGLSKSYAMAHKAREQTTLAETLMNRLRYPFQWNKHEWNKRKGDKHELFWALQDVTFDIRKGDVVGIIGRNGAGKSTLLKILSRITEPTTGTIKLYGRVGSLLEVGTGFHPELTGRENIGLNGAILGMSKREIAREFDAIVAFAGIENFLDTPVKRYSSGMYVRLAFAVAAHLNTEILIVDEVLAVGDAEFQQKCLGKIKAAATDGRTVLFVSHNMGVVTSLCNWTLWMEKGMIQDVGDTRRIVPAYLFCANDPTSPSVDLSTMPRAESFGEMLRLQQIEWLTGIPLQHGEEVCVRIDFAANVRLEGVAIGLGFCTPEGTRLLSYDTDFEAGYRRTLQADERLSVQLHIPNLPLAPGQYALDVGARSGDRCGLDYLPACSVIEVVPGPTTPGSIIRPGAGVRLPGRWDWKVF